MEWWAWAFICAGGAVALYYLAVLVLLAVVGRQFTQALMNMFYGPRKKSWWRNNRYTR